jgi:hypothetical protein
MRITSVLAGAGSATAAKVFPAVTPADVDVVSDHTVYARASC